MIDKSFYKSWDKKTNNRKLEDYNKHNIFKSILKYLLPFITVIIFIIIFQWVKNMPEYELINFSNETKDYEPDSVIKPKLLLKSKNNKPILIQATNTKKDVNNSNILFFDKPNGHYKLSKKITIYFSALNGILYIKENELKLNKEVEIKSSEGTNLKTTNISYDIENNVINGNENVTLIGDWGELLGKGFIYNINKSIIILNGRPKVTFKNNRGLI